MRSSSDGLLLDFLAGARVFLWKYARLALAIPTEIYQDKRIIDFGLSDITHNVARDQNVMTMNKRPRIRRVDIERVRQLHESLSQEQLWHQNVLDHERVDSEYAIFRSAYSKSECYLCGKPFGTISKADPCLHWLLRQGKFRKKDFPLLWEKFGYINIAAFLRWVANEERFQGNINDIEAWKSERKVFEYTIKWRHLEWTFDCTKNDYQGHDGANADFPHFHFQMRINQRPFINFNDFHVPFNEEDLFKLDLARELGDLFYFSFGEPGAGMQSAVEIPAEDVVQDSTVVEDIREATYDLSTMILPGEDGLSGEKLLAMYEESKATGKTIASLASKYFPNAESVKTIISPSNSIPEVAKISERKRR